MKILITGATGLIGKALVNHLANKHDLGLVGRDIKKLHRVFKNTDYEIYDWQTIQNKGVEILSNYDVVINLAGENIGAKRWSSNQKDKILKSRINVTALLANLCVQTGKKDLRLLNASAIGIYGFADRALQATTVFNEQSKSTDKTSFVVQVAQAWEGALSIAENADIPVTKMRFGVVLAKEDGALAKQLLPFKLGLGAIIGNGEQPFSWISLTDMVRAIEFIIETPEITGSINIVADDIITQREFSKTLARYLNRPCFLKLPSPFVKLIFGEMGNELLIQGQNVSNEKLKSFGFKFLHANLEQALRAELG